jgi:hypothetical protein
VLAETDSRLGTSTSLWKAARQLSFFLDQTYREYLTWSSDAECEVAIAGFYEDGLPGIAHLTFGAASKMAYFSKPPLLGFRGVPVGDNLRKNFIRNVMEGRQDSGELGMDDLLAAVWHVIDQELTPTIGGGLSSGLCTSIDERFKWPLVECGGLSYYRGIAIARSSLKHMTTQKFSFDSNFMGDADRSHELSKISGSQEEPTVSADFEIEIEQFICNPFVAMDEPPELSE